MKGYAQNRFSLLFNLSTRGRIAGINSESPHVFRSLFIAMQTHEKFQVIDRAVPISLST